MPKGLKGFQKGNKVSKGKQAKTKSAERQRAIFNKMVDEHWKPIILAQVSEALTDEKAREYVINQRIGRPKESVETVVELKGLVLDI